MIRLPRTFFARDTHAVAKELLGKVLMRRWRGQILAGRISEVECYIGENDKACHAARGRTKRTEVMFGEAGHAYVYLVYGMYYCLNIVTDRVGFPAAVLIRGLSRFNVTADELVEAKWLEMDGPGKVCREMHIGRAQNGEDLTVSNKLWVMDDGFSVKPKEIMTSPRIGVAYAGKDALLPWRYMIKNPKSSLRDPFGRNSKQ